jgi:hypothetical protein
LSYIIPALSNGIRLCRKQNLVFQLKKLAHLIFYFLQKLAALIFDTIGYLTLLIACSIDLGSCLTPVKNRDVKSERKKLPVLWIVV